MFIDCYGHESQLDDNDNDNDDDDAILTEVLQWDITGEALDSFSAVPRLPVKSICLFVCLSLCLSIAHYETLSVSLSLSLLFSLSCLTHCPCVCLFA